MKLPKSHLSNLEPLILLAAILALPCLKSPAHAGVLGTVPMQGGMVMPMISYRADTGRLHVTMPTETVQLIPLLVSHPGDRFNPADPWFEDLDPSRRGLAFSRRYGFVMDTMTDPLPEGTQIYIRKIEGAPELAFYRYSANPPLWQPIFGTGGTPDTLAWNGMMFHPAVAAPPGTNVYQATFEAYLVETATGRAVPNSSTGPFVLEWTSRPDGRPALHIVPGVRIRWPETAGNWVLEQTADLASGTWETVPAVPYLQDGHVTLWIEPNAPARFYRLRQGP